ncbi:hypothetical protein HDE68_004431 [Pedobacter cryoconitis]|uniref:DUF4064 domain-containing protein n=1 Tax=Pedobacter cryoconitis TaxID=188932 RepID=A0A7W9E1Q4_9SPHI|nr:hypothetical protein [Pedobacter cryoconitis]MBB5638499.1 hypothetical protein [Pedobacter cryoconitis]
MKFLLVLMIVFSFIGGFSINGVWSFLFQFEFIDMLNMIKMGNQSSSEVVAWIAILIGHIGIISLPFLTKNIYFKVVLLSAPLLFILGFIASVSILAIVFLFPLIITWIIAVIYRNKIKRYRDE